MRGLLEKVDLQGITVTLDAGNTSCETMQALQQHGADTLVTLKGNTGSAYDRLAQDGPWAGPEVRRTAKALDARARALGAPQTRHEGTGPGGLAAVAGDAAGVPGHASHQADGAGLGAAPAAVHRGHWTVENRNHLSRDVSLDEDRSRVRAVHGPSNNAALNNLVLALLLRSGQGQRRR